MRSSLFLTVKKFDFIIYCIIAIVLISFLIYMSDLERNRLAEISQSPEGKTFERIMRRLKVTFLFIISYCIIFALIISALEFFELGPWIHAIIWRNVFAQPAPPAPWMGPPPALPPTPAPPYRPLFPRSIGRL